ncbi:cadherin-15-like [Sinocyclocheilus grahami]|uniref:cadherin-15-like n=1 Tax=Sinocyclocheilus grahami TaxID=75366 RepID=UPI0007ACD4E8|nr:PREDICTED: cadherin-15-like [Sinocyclocheilus grahami]
MMKAVAVLGALLAVVCQETVIVFLIICTLHFKCYVSTLLQPLDYESQAEYQLFVKAENDVRLKAPYEQIHSATVTVRVMNENEAPVFYKNPIKVNVAESTVPGTVLVSDIAHDPDNAKLSTMKPCRRCSWIDILFCRRIGRPIGAALATLALEMDFTECTLISKTPCFWFCLFTCLLPETHAVLQPLIDIEKGEFSIPVVVSDSGSPSLSSNALVNVTVCPCDRFGDCKSYTAVIFGTKTGISFIALMIIMGCIALLLFLIVLAVAVKGCTRQNIRKGGGLLVGASDDDIRDNVFHYDEQGGGEEDEDAFNIDFLRNPSDMVPAPASFSPQDCSLPRGKQPLRKDAPHNLPSPTYPRKPPGDPTDIEDFINVGLDAADNDPNVPPYDTALIYDYEGDGSVAGSLSSIASMGSDGDQDYDYLNDWGPRFKKLANMYDPR